MQFRLALGRWYDLTRRSVALGLGAIITAQALAADATTPPSPAGAAAVPVDQKLFGELQWRGIGPYRGGRALAVAGIPGDASTFYFGAAAGGVWKTTDGGNTWLPLTDHTTISSVGALAVAP